jgi:hypothetical protein
VGSVFVEGGSANSTTCALIGGPTESKFNSNLFSGMVVNTTIAETQGLCGNSWVELNNTESLTKVTDATPTWGVNNAIVSIDPTGLVTFSAPVNTLEILVENIEDVSVAVVEKIGDYVAVHLTKSLNPYLMTLAKAGNWVYIQAVDNRILPANCGIFKILRFSQTETAWTYWIKNPNAIEADGQRAQFVNISEDSPIPGDTLLINSDAFGDGNKGAWKIVDVGHGYTDDYTLRLSIADRNPVPFTGDVLTLVKDVVLVEKNPNQAIKKVLCVSQNSSNTSLADVLLDDNSSLRYWNQAYGTVMTNLNKLNFPNTIKLGNDAYKYDTGLIAEAKRVIVGDSADVDNYPGYVAEGAEVLIQGPTIKQIKLTLQVRLQSNTPSNDVIGAIKSAAAGVINGSLVGVSIAFSDIVSAVQSVNGVIAVSVVTPNYSAVQDQIPLRGQEKGLVVNLENDITVLIMGN